jgi:hypothetical protein
MVWAGILLVAFLVVTFVTIVRMRRG